MAHTIWLIYYGRHKSPLKEPHLILKSRVYSREVVHINMAINNIIHGISAEATDLEYRDSNLTLMRHNLFEANNEWQFTSYAYHIGDYDDEMIAEAITKDGFIWQRPFSFDFAVTVHISPQNFSFWFKTINLGTERPISALFIFIHRPLWT